jgi:PAS domain S-box-containing protein
MWTATIIEHMFADRPDGFNRRRLPGRSTRAHRWPTLMVMLDLRDPARATPPRALVLLADRTARGHLRALLEDLGWRAEPSAAGPEAVRARGIPPARVVIADWPRLEPAWPALLAARQAGGGAPYLLALVDPVGPDALAALSAGADDCLLRPVRPADLVARLGVAVRTGADRRAVRAALAAAARERERASAVLRALPDGLVVLARDGTVIEVNDGFCAMTGLAREHLVGRPSPFPDRPGEPGDAGGEYDVALPRVDGASFPAVVSVAPAAGPAGEQVVVATVRDVSRRVRAERVGAAVGRVAAVAASGVPAEVVVGRILEEVAALAPGARVTAIRRGGPPRAGGVAAPVRVDGVEWGAVGALPPEGGALPGDLADALARLAGAAGGAIAA